MQDTMHATLITGSVFETRHNEITRIIKTETIAPIDCVWLVVEKSSIGIDDVRAFVKRLLLKPYISPFTFGIIEHAELLTVQAQNALLKLLEEPPEHCRIILETQSAELLLATIRSRTSVVWIPGQRLVEGDAGTQRLEELAALLRGPLSKCLADISPIVESREKATIWIEETIHILHAAVKQGCRSEQENQVLTVPTIVSLLRRLQAASRYLQANVSPKLAVDSVFT
jgi:hypothetical protein